MRPLAIDLFCGLGGWTGGLLAEGWDVIGFDIEQHVYGAERYPAQLVVQDVLTLHGRQFKDVDLIVASPPCQAYSYMAMPWSRAKAKAAAIRADATGQALADLNALFNACFRIQREACEAAGRHVPMVVENVRGAIPWVGRSRWSFGSFHLWGDVPALMPQTIRAQKFNPDGTQHGQGSWFAVADSKERGSRKNGEIGGGSWFAIGSPGQTNVGMNPDGRKVPGFRFDGSGGSFQTASVEGVKVASEDGGRRTDVGKGAQFTSRDCGVEAIGEGLKQGGDWFSDPTSASRTSSSKSPARKRASAMIAKIPEALSRHIARTYFPRLQSEAA